MLERAASWVWFGRGPLPATARAALAPLELAYGAAVRARAALYDRGVLASRETAIPAVSVGNVTVGGTGKTPVAAWLASALAARGARPAVVMRGYGADEPLVHAALNPAVPVVVAPDRVAGTARAREQGCDVAVLDDAFQHRRARRVADVVLLSADRWDGRVRLLPAGPYREPLDALRRASLVLVTRKAADPARAEEAASHARRAAPMVPIAVAHLAPGELRSTVDGRTLPLDALRGARALAVCAVGDPAAFLAQLRPVAGHLDAAVFPDHHAFTAEEAGALAARAERADHVVCTLKDAVKLAAHWPRAARPLWYVSQRVVLERGGGEVERLVASVLGARPAHS
ncbi:MAG: tetraacyldisaccharide 4'-kinase [Gemmatimonadaceae bacterium]